MFGSSMFVTGNQPLSKERKPIVRKNTGKGVDIGRHSQNKQEKAIKKRIESNLSGSKFRILNELLYTSDSDKALEYFQENKGHFNDYHEGFVKQTEEWPVRPLDVIIQELSGNPVYNNNIIADLGCGEGLLYEYFEKRNRIGSEQDAESQKNVFKNILSYDLVSTKDFIKEVDIKNLPLDSEAIDTAVYCLALMGTNYLEFLMEAHRVLKVNGRLLVAEVLSRFTDLRLFVILIKKIGFKFVKYVKKNSYFILLVFKKHEKKSHIKTQDDLADLNVPKGYKPKIRYRDFNYRELSKKILQPCIYKKR